MILIFRCSHKSDFFKVVQYINPVSIEGGGGGDTPCDAKFCEKCPCSHNNSIYEVSE